MTNDKQRPMTNNDQQKTTTNNKQQPTTNNDQRQTTTNGKQRQTTTNDKQRQTTTNDKQQTTTNNDQPQTTANDKQRPTKNNNQRQTNQRDVRRRMIRMVICNNPVTYVPLILVVVGTVLFANDQRRPKSEGRKTPDDPDGHLQQSGHLRPSDFGRCWDRPLCKWPTTTKIRGT